MAAGGINIIKAETTIRMDVEEWIAYLRDISVKTEYDEMFETGHNVEDFGDGCLVTYQKYKK
jgi:hypothetical protein